MFSMQFGSREAARQREKMRLDSLHDFAVTLLKRAGIRADANETGAFIRQLEYIRTKTYDTRYPDLRARQLIPVANDVASGAESATFRSYDMAGMATLLSNYAEDLAKVKLLGGETTIRPKGLGGAYEYSLQDLRAAAFGNVPLSLKQPQAARRMTENSIDMIAMMGVSALSLGGFINNTNVPILSAPGAIHGAWLNGATTSQQILDDLHAIANFVYSNSKTVHAPDTMILPVTHYSKVASQSFSNLVPDSILSVFLKVSPYIKNVDQSLYLNDSSNGGGISMGLNGLVSTAAGGGAGGVARVVCYARNPEYLEMGVPQEFEQLPPEAHGLNFEVATHARTYGTFWHYPLSGVYADGV